MALRVVDLGANKEGSEGALYKTVDGRWTLTVTIIASDFKVKPQRLLVEVGEGDGERTDLVDSLARALGPKFWTGAASAAICEERGDIFCCFVALLP